nr:tyrosine-type recombinase/integrase [Pseudomonas sp. URMO17WK12:I1]
MRIRFTWNKVRRCETLPYPQTPKGIAAAAGLLDQVKQLNRMGMLTEEKYLELFPNTTYVMGRLMPTFGQYTQTWLDSRQIVKNTRDNYKRVINSYWMPYIATMPINEVRSLHLRKALERITWPSQTDRRFALNTLSGIFKAAIADELMTTNPVGSLPRGKVQPKEIDPFLEEEADRVIAHMHETLDGRLRMYAYYFETAFFTGLRPCEELALKPGDIDLARRRVNISRVMVKGEIHERVKTKYARVVLLNERALKALGGALAMMDEGDTFVFKPTDGRGAEFITTEETPKRHFKAALEALGIRDRRQYATRHTYATICLMAGMTPAFVAKQLGHSVQVLLERYARWIDSEADFLEIEKLKL